MSLAHAPDCMPTREVFQSLEDLARRWGVAPYTLRAAAREGRVTGRLRRGSRWFFAQHARLCLGDSGSAQGGGANFVEVDLAKYPLTADTLAARWACTEATVCRWARKGLLTPAVRTPWGWRFGDEVRDPHAPAALPDGEAARVSAATRLAEDPLAALRALSFKNRERTAATHVAPVTLPAASRSARQMRAGAFATSPAWLRQGRQRSTL
jgi:hypothetical protein